VLGSQVLGPEVFGPQLFGRQSAPALPRPLVALPRPMCRPRAPL